MQYKVFLISTTPFKNVYFLSRWGFTFNLTVQRFIKFFFFFISTSQNQNVMERQILDEILQKYTIKNCKRTSVKK